MGSERPIWDAYYIMAWCTCEPHGLMMCATVTALEVKYFGAHVHRSKDLLHVLCCQSAQNSIIGRMCASQQRDVCRHPAGRLLMFRDLKERPWKSELNSMAVPHLRLPPVMVESAGSSWHVAPHCPPPSICARVDGCSLLVPYNSVLLMCWCEHTYCALLIQVFCLLSL